MLEAFIQAQRQLANLLLRQLSVLTEVSNPYLSQVERRLPEAQRRALLEVYRSYVGGTQSQT